MLLLLLFPFFFLSADEHFPWVVYYNDKEPVEAFKPYNPIIFETLSHPPLDPLLKMNKEILGYLALGEVSEWHPWFSSLKEQGILVHENNDWPKSWMIDIRQPFWKQLLLTEIIPNIFNQGFTGLFFDQLDVPLEWEKKNPAKYKGMTAAAVDLIKAIRTQFPGKRLMLNRAYEILPQVGNMIDYELAETLYTSYDFQTKKYFVRPSNEFDWQVSQLNKARTQFPHLVVFSLDYWDPKDAAVYKKIYELARHFCIRPYVSTIELDQIIPEPTK